MKKIFFILLLSCSSMVNAEGYLCVAESVAGVLHKDKEFRSVARDNVSAIKYIIARDLDTWKLTRQGAESDILDNCPTSQYCISTRGYAGVFLRSNNGTFTVSWMQQTDDGWLGSYIAKGLCRSL